MKTIILLAAATALVIAASAAAAKPTPPIAVMHPWIALPPGGAPTAAGYAVIRNQSSNPDTFLGASTPDAQKFELHNMSMTGGVMRMRPVQGGLLLAPGRSLALQPGGAYHFMLVRPHHPLKLGDRIPAVLTFARAGGVKTVFVVEAPAAPSAMTMR